MRLWDGSMTTFPSKAGSLWWSDRPTDRRLDLLQMAAVASARRRIEGHRVAGCMMRRRAVCSARSPPARAPTVYNMLRFNASSRVHATSLVSRSSRALSSKAFNQSDIGEGIGGRGHAVVCQAPATLWSSLTSCARCRVTRRRSRSRAHSSALSSRWTRRRRYGRDRHGAAAGASWW